MSLVSTDRLIYLCDKLCQAYVRANSASGQTYGVGEYGDTDRSAGCVADISTNLLASSDATFIAALLPGVTQSGTNTSSAKLIGSALYPIMTRLSRYFLGQASASYSDFDTFLKYMNVGGGGTFALPIDHRFRALYNGAFGGSRYPSTCNLIQEILQGSTYTNAMGKSVGTGAGTNIFTDGTSISSSSYGGAIPRLNVSSVTGSGVVTVTGTEADPASVSSSGAMTTTSGKTWTVSVSVAGYYYFTGGTHSTNALIVDVSGISVAAGLSAGTMYVEGQRGEWRSSTCTAGTSTTITLDASASSITDIYVGMQIGHSGDKYTWRTISAYNGTTKVATVSSAWATNPTGVETYKILRLAL